MRLTDAEYAAAIPAAELHVLSRLFVSGFDRYSIALLFWSMGTMATAWVWWRSGAVPRVLAAFGVASSAWAMFCTVSLFPAFPTIVHLAWFDVPMVGVELAVVAAVPRSPRGSPNRSKPASDMRTDPVRSTLPRTP